MVALKTVIKNPMSVKTREKMTKLNLLINSKNKEIEKKLNEKHKIQSARHKLFDLFYMRTI